MVFVGFCRFVVASPGQPALLGAAEAPKSLPRGFAPGAAWKTGFSER